MIRKDLVSTKSSLIPVSDSEQNHDHSLRMFVVLFSLYDKYLDEIMTQYILDHS